LEIIIFTDPYRGAKILGLKTWRSRTPSQRQLLKKFALQNARWTQTFYDGFSTIFTLKSPVFPNKLRARGQAKT